MTTAKLADLINDGVKMLCAAEVNWGRRSVYAGIRVRDAFLDKNDVFPEWDRLAARQAIAAALRRHGPSTEWAEHDTGIAKDYGGADEDPHIVGLARALAVAVAVNQRLPPRVASDDATRDTEIALHDLRRRINPQQKKSLEGFIKKFDDEKQLGDVLNPPPKAMLQGLARWVNKRIARLVKNLGTAVTAALATAPSKPPHAAAEPPADASAGPSVLDPDPWWVPRTAVAAPATSSPPANVSADAQVTLLASLLTAYSTQFGSYTSLLWQVPALGLTAQAFLLTIALTAGNGDLAKLTAAVLSTLIAAASSQLMHDQRGHAINHGELALRVSKELRLAKRFGTLNVEDAEPSGTDAETVWVGWDHRIYGVWRTTLYLFIVADLIVVISVILAAFQHKH